ncbi:TPA: VOC family protein [Serratia odorifera]|uniref:VOC family protein n=1 Tax=Serratia odorifera TaxID=618 RepID=UPI0018E8B17F|nr:VOC family protein [Serratia odorifera]MBJ2065938.1 VOC family protein [Serratia odorifera]
MELKIERVIETALYVSDMARASQFYETVLLLPAMVAKARFRAYDVGGQNVLLLFVKGDALGGSPEPTGYIPPHDGHGPYHIGLAVSRQQLPAWERQLAQHGVEIEGRMNWPRGGESLYFRDPDHHLLELVTPGLWDNY